MKVDVIIPVYNGESYVEKAISSVQIQTHSNFQLIIVDDGSTDATPTIVDRFASTDTRIEVVHQQNAGVAAARQNGVNLAKGDYLMFVDADDWIDETTIDRMLCKATETSADMVWSDALFEIEGPDKAALFLRIIFSKTSYELLGLRVEPYKCIKIHKTDKLLHTGVCLLRAS